MDGDETRGLGPRLRPAAPQASTGSPPTHVAFPESPGGKAAGGSQPAYRGRTSEPPAAPVHTVEPGPAAPGTASPTATEPAVAAIGGSRATTAEIGPVGKATAAQTGTAQTGTAQTGTAQTGTAQTGTAQTGTAIPTAAEPNTAAAGTASAAGASGVPAEADTAPKTGRDKSGTAESSTAAKTTATETGTDKIGTDKTGTAENSTAAKTTAAKTGTDKTGAAESTVAGATPAPPGTAETAVQDPYAGGGQAGADSGQAAAGTPAQPRSAVPPDGGGDTPGGHRRTRYAHALRRAWAPRSVARRLRAWARRPSGRLALPSLLLVSVLGATGAAGAFLIPATAERANSPTSQPTPSTGESAPPGYTALPTFPPAISGTLGPTGTAVVRRPADALKGWAAQVSPKVGVPTTALEAYGYAELVVSQTKPTCGLKWTTLAAIGKVESGHGSANGATLLADGRSTPTILGPPLDGTNGNKALRDTDHGTLDGDLKWDRAVGPMQFIPTTWESYAVDADNDGMRDPGDIDDATLAAANYLCQDGRNLANIGDWWAAILTYNAVQPYAQSVYQAANDYGVKSRS